MNTFALYQFLTVWRDFTPAEAREYIENATNRANNQFQADSSESIDCSMEQTMNRRAA